MPTLMFPGVIYHTSNSSVVIVSFTLHLRLSIVKPTKQEAFRENVYLRLKSSIASLVLWLRRHRGESCIVDLQRIFLHLEDRDFGL